MLNKHPAMSDRRPKPLPWLREQFRFACMSAVALELSFTDKPKISCNICNGVLFTLHMIYCTSIQDLILKSPSFVKILRETAQTTKLIWLIWWNIKGPQCLCGLKARWSENRYGKMAPRSHNDESLNNEFRFLFLHSVRSLRDQWTWREKQNGKKHKQNSKHLLQMQMWESVLCLNHQDLKLILQIVLQPDFMNYSMWLPQSAAIHLSHPH